MLFNTLKAGRGVTVLEECGASTVNRRRCVCASQTVSNGPVSHEMGDRWKTAASAGTSVVIDGAISVSMGGQQWNRRASGIASRSRDCPSVAIDVGVSLVIGAGACCKACKDCRSNGVASKDITGKTTSVGVTSCVDPCWIDAVAGFEVLDELEDKVNVIDTVGVGVGVTLPLLQETLRVDDNVVGVPGFIGHLGLTFLVVCSGAATVKVEDHWGSRVDVVGRWNVQEIRSLYTE